MPLNTYKINLALTRPLPSDCLLIGLFDSDIHILIIIKYSSFHLI